MAKQLSPQQIRHLHQRAGFGMPLTESIGLKAARKTDTVKVLFKASEKIRPIELFDKSPRKTKLKDLPPEERKKFRQTRRQQLRELNLHWLEKMATSPAQLREKMTFFWHDHFAARVEHPFGMQDLNNLMRRHALGNFRTLLMQVSKHPVMLEYLNAKQNRKASPNENFARELMELFTLGTGHYTEKDIKESARAFTGWSFNPEGEFVFRKRVHDEGQKSFRGKTGNFKGEDIVKQLLDDQQTARYICGKLYRFLVNPQTDAKRVEAMTQVFFPNYDIGALVEYVLLQDWFYDAAHLGMRIKSPAELLAGMTRSLSLDFESLDPLIRVQKTLGQVLFQPPNVSGWPEGKAWIDSSTLSLRMTLPAVLLLGAKGNFKAKADLMDMDIDLKSMGKLRKIKASADWSRLEKSLNGISEQDLPQTLAEQLFQVHTKGMQLQFLDRMVDKSSRQQYLKTLTVHLMSLPEYQLS